MKYGKTARALTGTGKNLSINELPLLPFRIPRMLGSSLWLYRECIGEKYGNSNSAQNMIPQGARYTPNRVAR